MATNTGVNKPEAAKVSSMTHDGLAKCISTVYIIIDGVIIFNTNNGLVKNVDPVILGTMAAEVVDRATVESVKGI